METALTFSRGQFQAFLECQRRFKLRYLHRLSWPVAPLESAQETAVQRGKQFHQLLERHFLGLKIEPQAIEDINLRRWWLAFRDNGPALPDGRMLPEQQLTVPSGEHLLTGRFDLLVIGEKHGRPFGHIFDWKTGRSPNRAIVHEDWQTRLYLAMLTESGDALLGNGRSFAPDDLTITYWYPKEPDAAHTIAYNTAWHRQNWAEIEQLTGQIAAQVTTSERDDNWPLTDNLQTCRRCSYRAYCYRQTAGHAAELIEDEEELDAFLPFEPELP